LAQFQIIITMPRTQTKPQNAQTTETIQGKTMRLKIRKKEKIRRRTLKSLLQEMTGIIDDLPSDLSINKYQRNDKNEP
jgi:hypothetical protein